MVPILWYEMQNCPKIFQQMERRTRGNLDLMVSGSAALQPRLANAAEIPVMEGYGLTKLHQLYQ
jgi:long-chain acyl-CoA synthetase